MVEWEGKTLKDHKAYFLKKEDSDALYGIAIIMMIFLHLFAIPSRMSYGYKTLMPLGILSKIAWSGDLCVSIYAFVSGYIMMASMVLFAIYGIAVVLVPFFIFSYTYICRLCHNNFMKRIGRYSIYMWLTHAFYAYYYFQKLILFPKYAGVIFIWETFITFVTAFILAKVYNLLKDTIRYCIAGK